MVLDVTPGFDGREAAVAAFEGRLLEVGCECVRDGSGK